MSFDNKTIVCLDSICDLKAEFELYFKVQFYLWSHIQNLIFKRSILDIINKAKEETIN